MRLEPTHPRSFYLAAVALLFLALPVALFWRPGLFFFMEDDWPLLAQLVSHPFWQFLAMPDGEVWMPLSRAVYYGMAHTFGEGYSTLLLVNCLLSGVLAFQFYLFLRQHFPPVTALVLGLFYGGAAAHTSLTQVAFYNNALLCFNFFLLALLLTQHYLQTSSRVALAGISLCVWLSLVSWNFTILAVWVLPLYIAILGGKEQQPRFWAVSAAVVLPFLAFTLAYFHFAGFSAAASHNRGIVSGLPGPAYLLHWFIAAILSPFFYLFWGHYHYPIWAGVLGVGALALSLGLIWGWGDLQERRLGLWALTFNALPIFLVSLARYQRGLYQAFAPRYAVYTLMGALILLGTAWGILKRRMSPGFAVRLLPLALLAVMVGGQIFSLPHWEKLYGQMSQASRGFYQRLDQVAAAPGAAQEMVPPQFWYPERLHLTWGEAASIRQFLAYTKAASPGQALR
ncbi:MAG: glycosyltransferase family protein [Desulfobaccales bacterium]